MQIGRPRIDTGGLTYSKWYYQNIRKSRERPSRRKNPEESCKFCGILMNSRFASKTRRYFCDDCTSRVPIKRFLNNLYTKRYYRKKHNLPPLSLDREIKRKFST